MGNRITNEQRERIVASLGLEPGSRVVLVDSLATIELEHPVVTVTDGGLVTLHGLAVVDVEDGRRYFVPMANVAKLELPGRRPAPQSLPVEWSWTTPNGTRVRLSNSVRPGGVFGPDDFVLMLEDPAGGGYDRAAMWAALSPEARTSLVAALSTNTESSST